MDRSRAARLAAARVVSWTEAQPWGGAKAAGAEGVFGAVKDMLGEDEDVEVRGVVKDGEGGEERISVPQVRRFSSFSPYFHLI